MNVETSGDGKKSYLQTSQFLGKNVSNHKQVDSKPIFSNKYLSNIARLGTTAFLDNKRSTRRKIEYVGIEKQSKNLIKTTVHKSKSRKKIFGPYLPASKKSLSLRREGKIINDTVGDLSFKYFMPTWFNKKK